MSKHSEIQIADNENYNLKFEIHFYTSYTSCLWVSYCFYHTVCVSLFPLLLHMRSILRKLTVDSRVISGVKISLKRLRRGSKEEWPQYIERLNHFLVANGIIDADKKKSAFLAGVGPATYTLARNLVTPDEPGDVLR